MQPDGFAGERCAAGLRTQHFGNQALAIGKRRGWRLQARQRPVQQISRRVPENGARRRIRITDGAVAIDHDDGVGTGFPDGLVEHLALMHVIAEVVDVATDPRDQWQHGGQRDPVGHIEGMATTSICVCLIAVRMN